MLSETTGYGCVPALSAPNPRAIDWPVASSRLPSVPQSHKTFCAPSLTLCAACFHRIGSQVRHSGCGCRSRKRRRSRTISTASPINTAPPPPPRRSITAGVRGSIARLNRRFHDAFLLDHRYPPVTVMPRQRSVRAPCSRRATKSERQLEPLRQAAFPRSASLICSFDDRIGLGPRVVERGGDQILEHLLFAEGWSRDVVDLDPDDRGPWPTP